MTKDELDKVPFTFKSSLSMEHEHCTVYCNKEYGFSFCTHIKKKKNGDFGRSYRHYLYQDKLDKSLDKFLKFLEAIKDVEFKARRKQNEKQMVSQRGGILPRNRYNPINPMP